MDDTGSALARVSLVRIGERDELGIVPFSPPAARDLDREQTARAIVGTTVWLSKLRGRSRELLVEALRRTPGQHVIATVQWFAMLERLLAVEGQTVDSVTEFVAVAASDRGRG